MDQRIFEAISTSKLKTRGREGGAGKVGDTVNSYPSKAKSPCLVNSFGNQIPALQSCQSAVYFQRGCLAPQIPKPRHATKEIIKMEFNKKRNM